MRRPAISLRRLCPILCSLWLLVCSRAFAQETTPQTIQFNRDIRPILSANCFACHGPDQAHREADLRLDVWDGGAFQVVDGEAVLLPGKPEASLLYQRISTKDEDLVMPPVETKKHLKPDEIALLKRWIEQGAKFESHWSFAPPKRPKVPQVTSVWAKNNDWLKNAIDAFVLQRLTEESLTPSVEAKRATLVRRLSFDLLGLPPSPELVDRFLKDQRPDAWEHLVDELLQSQHYGERMAMYWLDLVRYADTVGYHGDQDHSISPYRDWVIHAFNTNMKFDQFTREQLAGDLLPNATIDQRIASGYNRLLQTSHEGGVQVKEYLAKYSADRVRNVSSVWMAATVGCAECHDHKYDPYTQKDFYSLAAFFADVDDLKSFKGGNSLPTRRDPELVVHSPLDRQRIQSLEEAIAKLKNDDTAERERLKKQLQTLQKNKRRTMVTVAIKPRDIRILDRGDWMDTTGKVVSPAPPHFLKQIPTEKQRANRLDLANWLTSPDHPQTARVFVNRLWYLMFGTGLSNSLDDNGSQGEWPTHPELLDWLAVEFIESGWDIKHMVRLIVTSKTYQQSSLVSAELAKRDPENRLLARQSRFRLPAEMIRDNALAVSGLLVNEVGGVSVKPYQPTGYYAHLNFPTRKYSSDGNQNQYRRGVYVHWQRQFLHPMLKAFDAPSREECTARRAVSNTPSAALNLLNDPTFLEAARVLAQRFLQKTKGQTDAQRVKQLWKQVLTREISAPELDAYLAYLGQLRPSIKSGLTNNDNVLNIGLAPVDKSLDQTELLTWTMMARVLLNLNETITRN